MDKVYWILFLAFVMLPLCAACFISPVILVSVHKDW